MIFSRRQIAKLKEEYNLINRIDPCIPNGAYDKLTKFLDGLDDDGLMQLYKAKIKWISNLSCNRLINRGLI